MNVHINTPWIIILFQGRDRNESGGGESVEADYVTNLSNFIPGFEFSVCLRSSIYINNLNTCLHQTAVGESLGLQVPTDERFLAHTHLVARHLIFTSH